MSYPFAPYGAWPRDPRETSQEHAARNRAIREAREQERLNDETEANLCFCYVCNTKSMRMQGTVGTCSNCGETADPALYGD